VGVLPSGPFSTLIRLPFDSTNANARFDHSLGRSHALRGVYEFLKQERSNVRDLDLPERLSTGTVEQHSLRLSDTGSVGERVVNEIRFHTEWVTTGTSSASSAPTTIVQGAFNAGGAGLDNARRSRESELIDHVSFGRGRHSFKVGGQVDSGWYTYTDHSNLAGTFTFPGLVSYQAGRPQQFAQRSGSGVAQFNQFLFGAYAQDDIRLRKNLSLSVGVRWESQTHVTGHGNPAPRVGFAWAPFRSGRTTFRGGAGIFYQWLGADLFAQTMLLDGTRQSDLVLANPGYPDPFSGGPPPAALPGSITTLAPQTNQPYVMRGSIGLQQQVTKYFMLMTDVRLQRGVHLLDGRSFLRPDGGRTLEIESAAVSSNRGWMVMVSPAPSGGFGKRFFWYVNYLCSQVLNETDNPQQPPANSFDRHGDWGPSSNDVRHRFSAMLSGSPGRGFQLGTLFRATSASPYNITAGADLNRDTILNDRPAGIGRNNARGSGLIDLGSRVSWSHGVGTRKGPAEPTRSLVRIGGDSPNIPEFGSGAKPDAPQPILRYQFYAQAFNLLNHGNLTNYVGVITSPLFGNATAALPGRRLELGVKLSF